MSDSHCCRNDGLDVMPGSNLHAAPMATCGAQAGWALRWPPGSPDSQADRRRPAGAPREVTHMSAAHLTIGQGLGGGRHTAPLHTALQVGPVRLSQEAMGPQDERPLREKQKEAESP